VRQHRLKAGELLILVLAAAVPSGFTCDVVRVHDGDGPLWCRSGQKVRVAGIQAPDFESAEPCRRPVARRATYICDNRAAARGQRIVASLVLGKRLTCQPVDTSYRRVARCTLPDGRSLSCALIAAGAAVRWDRYWVRYGMGGCA
jgi:endonuclease YncB( thermonuclease family)